MTISRLTPLVRQLYHLARPPFDTCRDDAALLQRFTVQGDEAAFATLVRRHGPMVFGVCRRVLRDEHTAEDAFQATFLLLARKARSLRQPERLGPWLYGVAYRTAVRARSDAVRRRRHEAKAVSTPADQTGYDPEAHELRSLLDEAVHRLPARYRNPVIFCYLEAKTNAQAASLLGCSRGTIATRLARARQLLRRFLLRRGVSAPVVFGGAAVPPALSTATSQAAVLAAAGQSLSGAAAAGALVLMKGVEKAMWWSTIKLAGVVALSVALTAGVGFSLSSAPDGQPAEAPKAPPPKGTAAPKERLPFPADAPTAQHLMAYLNDNAKRMPALRCDKVAIDLKWNNYAIGMEGMLAMQTPHNVRMKCNCVGQPAIDLGSSEEGWWFWFSKRDGWGPLTAKREDVVREHGDTMAVPRWSGSSPLDHGYERV